MSWTTKRYCFDIDGTIYFTARGMGRCDGNIACAYSMWYTLTYNQLNDWGCEFHQLILGKPHADHYIDDKGIFDKNFFK